MPEDRPHDAPPGYRIMVQHRAPVRVRYAETDAQGRVHHANYFVWFELARTELLRACGITYREFETLGFMLVVRTIAAKYHKPAFYDDQIEIEVRTVKSRGVRIEQVYHVWRDSDLLAEGQSELVCVDRNGRVRPLPDWLDLREVPSENPPEQIR